LADQIDTLWGELRIVVSRGEHIGEKPADVEFVALLRRNAEHFRGLLDAC
jgi:hypothetical protein